MTNSPTPTEKVAARLAKYEERLRARPGAFLRALDIAYPGPIADASEALCGDLRSILAELATLQAQRDRLAVEALRPALNCIVGMRRGEPEWCVVTLTYETSAWALQAHEALTVALTNQPEHREESK